MAALVLLAVVWGLNMAVIKVGSAEMAPLFMAAVRSTVAAACLLAVMLVRGVKLFPTAMTAFHGMMVGLLFGVEFALIYVGLTLTTASRVYILVYTAPLWVALGAHFFLKGDRLSRNKVVGLLLAFAGVVVLFARDLESLTGGELHGDLLALGGGALWGATTLYIKKYLAERTEPVQTLFYQVAFSAPLLIVLSLLLEDRMVFGFTWMGAGSLFYQCIIVVFLSYLLWFHLVHRHPVSLLHAFTFLTPVVGVFLSGTLILGEPLTLRILAALTLVSLGLVAVNR